MNNVKRTIWGIVLICVGVLLVLEKLHLLHFNPLFQGWWALFVIVPSAISLITEKNRLASFWGLTAGVLLLLCARNILEWQDMGYIFLAFFIASIGMAMLFHPWPKKEKVSELTEVNRDGLHFKKLDVAFSHQEVSYDDQLFEGLDIKSSFGLARCDLRQAEIQNNAVINVQCAFGGVEILVPADVTVKVLAHVAFGAIEDKRKNVINPTEKSILLTGDCSFGSVVIK